MEKISVIKNYLYNSGYQILVLITPLITMPYIARVLGADGIGVFSYTSSIIAYFLLLADFGCSGYGAREIAYIRDNIDLRSKIFYEVIILKFIFSLISFVFYAITVWVLFDSRLIYWIQGLNILSSLLDITWFFQGIENFKKIFIRNVSVKILNILGIFLLVKTKNDLFLYVLLLAGSNVLSSLVVWRYMPAYLKKVPINTLHPFERIKIVIQFFLPAIIGSVYLVLDKTMLGTMVNSPAENGYYEQAEKMTKMPIALITSFSTVMMPKIAYNYYRKKYEEIEKNMILIARYNWFLSIPICLGLFSVADNFVPWFLGPGYDEVVTLIKILSFITIVISMSVILSNNYMIATNQQNKQVLVLLIGAIINLVLNMYLIPSFLSVGTAIATLITEIIINGMLLYILRKQLPIIKIFSTAKQYIFSGVLMAIAICFMSKFLLPSLLNTFYLIVVGMLVYVCVLRIMHDDIIDRMFLKAINKLKNMF